MVSNPLGYPSLLQGLSDLTFRPQAHKERGELPFPVDDHGGWDRLHSVSPGRLVLHILVDRRGVSRIFPERLYRRPVFVADRQDLQALARKLLMKRHRIRQALLARSTPRGPEVDQNHLPLKGSKAD